MQRRCLTAVLMVSACSSPGTGALHDRLHNFANAGLIRVGDLIGGKLDRTRLNSAQECAVLGNPDARLLRADLDVRMGLCIKAEDTPVEIASAD